MTQEEKAKAYDESLERAKKLYEQGTITESLSYIFPELKESEDERIRKELISFLQLPHPQFVSERKQERWIAWLEKQKTSEEALQYLRENHSSSEMSDFQAAMNIAIAKAYDKGYNDGLEKQGEQKKSPCDKCRKAQPSHSCSDITALGRCALEKQGEQKSADKVEPKFEIGDLITNGILIGKIDEINEHSYHAYFGDHYADVPDIENWHKWTIQDAKDGDVLSSLDSNQPFIYKERNGYEQATAYCGLNIYGKFFVWGTKDCVITLSKYVPATKEQRDILFQKMHEAGYEWDSEKKELKEIEQKPTDEEIKTLLRIEYEKGRADAIAEMNNPAWNEDDEEFLRRAINTTKDNYPMTAKWLKSLKDRVQPKQEWNEEDIRNIEDIDSILFYNKDIPEDTCMRLRNWLKSLRPQNRWKPSDEQMKALRVLNLTGNISYAGQGQVLIELYNNLKKLTE